MTHTEKRHGSFFWLTPRNPSATLLTAVEVEYPVNIQQQKLNHQITAPQLRIIGEQGENLGVMSKEDALKLAEQKGLDLIEVGPNAAPPIARLMSYDKFRYEQGKKLRKQREQGKGQEMKQIQISVKEARHDLEIKAKRIDEFLTEGHPVSIVMNLRGREKANKDWALKKMREFLPFIHAPFTVAMEPRWGGRGFVMQLNKK